MKFINTLDQHIRSPDVSLGDYLQAKQVSLGATVNTRIIVYLDTKFWLILRDVELGREKNLVERELYRLVNELSVSKKCIFPIGEDVFLEVVKQSDVVTRNTTACLIDRLSEGVSLVSLEERVDIEVFDFFSSYSNIVYPARSDLVWTKLPYCLGFMTPKINLDENLSLAIEKAFVDQFWICSLSEMLSALEGNSENVELPVFKIASMLNEGKFSHTQENGTYTQMFQSELAGLLDVFKVNVLRSTKKLFLIREGRVPSQSEIEKSKTERLTINCIYNGFRLNKIKKEFPSFRILAGLHASVRWNTNQKFKDNDMHDFHHAAAALPYAQYFFTERSLRHLITQNKNSFDVLYNCTVESDVGRSISQLEKIE